MAQQSSIDISVIIPTHNRSLHLQETLGDLAHQVTDHCFTYEVIVVDNNSQDETKPIVEHLAGKYPVPLIYRFEGRQGRSFALNTGLSAARGQIVAMTDDDVRMASDWLLTIHSTFLEQHADGVGGPVRPLWLSTRPAWLTDRFVRQLGVSDHGSTLFQVTDPQHMFIGPNSAWRRSLLERLNGFDESRINNSEDVELFLRALRSGARLIYQPAILLYNKIDPNRWTPKTIAKRFFRQGRACALGLQEHGTARSVFRIPLWIVRFYAQLHWDALRCWLAGDRDEARWHWLRRYLYLGIIVHCFKDWVARRPVRPLQSSMISSCLVLQPETHLTK